MCKGESLETKILTGTGVRTTVVGEGSEGGRVPQNKAFESKMWS